LAHEYLHWVWSNLEPAERERLTAYVNIVYGENHTWFDTRTSTMNSSDNKPGSESLTDELHSFCGTELDQALLPPELNQWYDKWLHNRSTLPRNLQR
jgi:hypothetical protein